MEVVDLKDDVILTSCSLDMGNATCSSDGSGIGCGNDNTCSWNGTSCVIHAIPINPSNITDFGPSC